MRDIDELAAEICTLTGHINAAHHRHWLNWKCGIALGAAREEVRVARAPLARRTHGPRPGGRHPGSTGE